MGLAGRGVPGASGRGWQGLGAALALVLLMGYGTAQGASPQMTVREAATAAEAAREGQVVLFNRPVVTFRATVLGLTPEEPLPTCGRPSPRGEAKSRCRLCRRAG